MTDDSGEHKADGDTAQGGELRQRMRVGAVLWGIGNLAARGIKVPVLIVLAWQLEPTDFGLVAMTASLLMVMQIFADFGIGTAIIQRQDAGPSYHSSAFWLNMIMSTALFLLVWVAAPYVTIFYGRGEVTLLLRVSALSFIISGLRVVPMGLLRKELRFGRYATLDATWSVASGILAIALAFMGAAYWSLVLPAIITGLLWTPLWYWASRWRPTFKLDIAACKDVFAYSKDVVAVSFILLILHNAGFIIAGRLLAADAAGQYKFAFDNAMLIVYNFAWLIGNVSLTGFAIAQTQPERLRKGFGEIFDILLATTLPAHLFLFALAGLIFEAVFPPQWAPAVPLFRILLIYAAMRALVAHITPFYNAVDRAALNMKFYTIVAIVTVPTMYFACARYGLSGLVWATALPQALGAAVILLLTPRLMNWAGLGYLSRSAPFLLATLVMTVLAKASALGLEATGVHPLVNVFACCAIAALSYIAVLVLFWPGRLQKISADVLPGRMYDSVAAPLFRRVGRPTAEASGS